MFGAAGALQEVCHMQGPLLGEDRGSRPAPIPFLHFLKGRLICCCLTFNGKSLHLLRHGNTISAGRGKGGCREATWASSQAAIFSSAFLLQAGMCLGACIVIAGPKVGIYPCSTKTREILGNSSPTPKRFPGTFHAEDERIAISMGLLRS